jgi:hypothetical protein
MGSGGDFAEVYAEDKRSMSAGLDDGRVEQVSSGRDRGAGGTDAHHRIREAEPDRLHGEPDRGPSSGPHRPHRGVRHPDAFVGGQQRHPIGKRLPVGPQVGRTGDDQVEGSVTAERGERARENGIRSPIATEQVERDPDRPQIRRHGRLLLGIRVAGSGAPLAQTATT